MKATLARPFNLVSPWAKKKDPLDFKIHVSLCIFRTIQTAVLDSIFKLMCIQKPKITVSHFVGDSLIDRARSREASDFYRNTDADVFCFFDDDIEVLPEDVVKVCQRAYELKGIVGGTCVIKREDVPWVAAKLLPETKEIMFAPDSPLVEVEYAGAGFMAVHRNVLTDMINGNGDAPTFECKLIDGEYVPIRQIASKGSALPFCHPKDLQFWPFFLPILHQNRDGDWEELSEDYSFCQRARDLGYKIWLDPSVRTVHFGVYGYDLSDICRQPREYYPKIRYIPPSDKNFIPKDDGVQIKPAFA